jgi:hypothetical protein
MGHKSIQLGVPKALNRSQDLELKHQSLLIELQALLKVKRRIREYRPQLCLFQNAVFVNIVFNSVAFKR